MLKRRRTHLQQKIYRPEPKQPDEEIRDQRSDTEASVSSPSSAPSRTRQQSPADIVTRSSIDNDHRESSLAQAGNVTPDSDIEWLFKDSVKRRRARM